MYSAVMRRLHAAGRLAAANFRRLESPLKVNLCLTYWCQYKCKTCNIWRRKPTDELTTDELLELVRRNPDVAWLDVTGGEIFLRDDVGEVLEAIVRSWRRLAVLHFPTNGFLTDKIVHVVNRVAAVSPVELVVTVSLDGDEAVNDEIRGIKGGFRRQIETFKALDAIDRVRVVFGMTLSQFNAGRFKETFDACARECPGLTIDRFHLNVAQVSAHYYGNEGSVPWPAAGNGIHHDLRLYRALRGFPASIEAYVESSYLRHMERFLETRRTPMRCHALRSSCFVDPWGTVYPCISYSKPVGCLRKTGMDLAPIWNSGDVRDLQAEIWRGECPQCWTACEAYQSILGNLVRM
jgi:MoaA/NifB/PqqE/SkfB family radical SAM enzyme